MSTWQRAFVEQSTLTAGHSNTINHLCFSPDGNYLASCGDDNSLIVWKAEEARQLYRSVFSSAVDCALWHPQYPDTLIVGCDNGYLFQIQDFSPTGSVKRQIELGVRSTIQCLSYDKTTRLLAAGVGAEVYTTREVTPTNYDGVSLFQPPPHLEGQIQGGTNSRGSNTGVDNRLRHVELYFLKSSQQLLVRSLSHGVTCWDMNTGDLLWRFVPDTFPHMGRSALNPNGEEIAVYNLVDGINLYSLRGSGQKRKPMKHFRLPKKPWTKHAVYVTYINDGRGLVCGTTTSDVYVWDVASGEVFQTLGLGKDDVVQAVAGSTRGHDSYIATGSTDKGQSTCIKLWRAKHGPEMVGVLGDRVSHVVRAVREFAKLTQAGALFKKWVLPSLYGMAAFTVWRWVLNNFPWGEYLNASASIILWLCGIFLAVLRFFGIILAAQYRWARMWIEDAVLERARVRLLLWLRVDELLAACPPGARVP